MITYFILDTDNIYWKIEAADINDFMTKYSQSGKIAKDYGIVDSKILSMQEQITAISIQKDKATSLGYVELAAQYQAQIDELNTTLTAIQNAPVIGD